MTQRTSNQDARQAKADAALRIAKELLEARQRQTQHVVCETVYQASDPYSGESRKAWR